MPTRLIALIFALFGAPVFAAPKVATDIPPVHSIASAVMEGAGAPTLIMRPGASPHGYAMRPSEAAALASADVVFWIGDTLTPWLDSALHGLGAEAKAVALMDADGVRLLPFRDEAVFEAEDHGHDRKRGHDHAHEGRWDPHIWLDPANGRAIAAAMAGALATADPANAPLYRANAAAYADRLTKVEAKIAARLAPMKDKPFIVFHDAYHYFEDRFGLTPAGAVSLSDAASPGPARVEAIRELIMTGGAVCVFSEPQFDTRLIATLTAGATAMVAELDPSGAGLAPGAELYPQLLERLASAIAGCLGG